MHEGPILTCSLDACGEAPKIWRRGSWMLFQLKIPSCSYQILAEKADVYEVQWVHINFKTDSYLLLGERASCPTSTAILHLKSVLHSQTTSSVLPLCAFSTSPLLMDFFALFSIHQELDFSSFTGGNLYLILHWIIFHLIPHPRKNNKDICMMHISLQTPILLVWCVPMQWTSVWTQEWLSHIKMSWHRLLSRAWRKAT